MRPAPDTETTRYGVFAEDEISFDIGGKRLAVIPNLRLDRTQTKAIHLENFVGGALTLAAAQTLYGFETHPTSPPPA